MEGEAVELLGWDTFQLVPGVIVFCDPDDETRTWRHLGAAGASLMIRPH